MIRNVKVLNGLQLNFTEIAAACVSGRAVDRESLSYNLYFVSLLRPF